MRRLLGRALVAVVMAFGGVVGAQQAGAQAVGAGRIVDDPFWTQPVRYIDFLLDRLQDEVRPVVEQHASSEASRLFTRSDIDRKVPPKVFARLNPNTHRAELEIYGLIVRELKASAREVCAYFFDDVVGPKLSPGARSSKQRKDLGFINVANLMPPSSIAQGLEQREAAAARLLEQLDLKMMIIEAKSRTDYECSRAFLGEEIRVEARRYGAQADAR